MAKTAPLALVTGASSGIGFELAKVFAEHGYDLVVCADGDGIQRAADELAQTQQQVHAVQQDLRTAAGVEELYRAATAGDRPIDAAALNAGIAEAGMFVATDLDDDLSLIDLNVRSTVHLAKLVLRDMYHRGAGRVLLTSSIMATMPGSYQAVYSATKAFTQSFAEAVRDELRDTGVTVTALLPGPTDTNLFRRSGLANSLLGRLPKDNPAAVVRQGFDALMAGRQQVVAASAASKVAGAVNHVLPDAIKVRASRITSMPLTRRH